MRTFGELTFRSIAEDDVATLTAIMTRAFDEDTRIHLGRAHGGPPGYDTGEFIRRYAFDPAATAYTICKDGQTIGLIILWINTKTHVNFLGTVFLDPPYANQGLGKTVWDFVEHAFPDTDVWNTETPVFSRRNHHFYINKCGFHVIRIENPKDPEEGMFVLQKRMKGG